MSKIKKMSGDSFENELNSNEVVCVAFKASWCGPCKIMTPILDQVSEEMLDVTIGVVDVEEERSLAMDNKVRNIPTLVFFKNGEEVKRLTGRQEKQVIMQELESLK